MFNMAASKKNKEKLRVSLNMDTTPIYYSDNISVRVSEDGVVLDVIQKVGSSDQARIVSRIGMSRDHAKKFVEKLGSLLLMTNEDKDKIIN